MNNFDVDTILQFNSIALNQAKKYPKQRFLYKKLSNQLTSPKDKIIGISGQRGIGKTVILKQLNNETDNSIYISFDVFNLKRYSPNDIYFILTNLQKRFGIKYLFIDEIHYFTEYPSLLKILYDFSELKVIFSSSMAIAISTLKTDLSRRIKIEYLYPFDFIEYLYFYYNLNQEYLKLSSVIKNQIPTNYLGFEKYFKNYLSGELFPFAFEVTNVLDYLKNIIEKIIFNDISKCFNFSVKDLQDIKEILMFIGKAEIDGINYTSISKNIGITKYKVKQFIEAMEKGYLINVVFPMGTNVKKEPKILLTLPLRLIYKNFEECIGGLREDFAVQMLKQKNFKFYYLKSKRGEKRPDYLIDYNGEKVIIEIGGKNKGYSQFKGIEKKHKKIVFKHNWSNDFKSLPLYSLGMC